jgi:hypothetical protein
MLRDVFQEGRFIRKTLVAGVTFKWFVCLVTPGMTLEVAELRKRLIAAWMPTFVWLVSRVRTDVLLQVRKLRKLPLTNFTSVWLDPQVYTCVL